MRDNSIEATIEYIETFIRQEKLTGKESLMIAIAYQAGILRGLNEAELEEEEN
jgi:hypothetical protein